LTFAFAQHIILYKDETIWMKNFLHNANYTANEDKFLYSKMNYRKEGVWHEKDQLNQDIPERNSDAIFGSRKI
jgi:hypothetical protein